MNTAPDNSKVVFDFHLLISCHGRVNRHWDDTRYVDETRQQFSNKVPTTPTTTRQGLTRTYLKKKNTTSRFETTKEIDQKYPKQNLVGT